MDNAIGLIVAAAVLDGLTVSGFAFVLAVAIFALVESIADPLLTRMATRSVRALCGGVGAGDPPS